MTDRAKLAQILTCIDLTTLEATDSTTQVSALAALANKGFEGLFPAAICVYPNLAGDIKNKLNPEIALAVVGAGFPTGQVFTAIKMQELQQINSTNCDEVDVVINRGALLTGDFDYVKNELVAMRAAVPGKIMKVILETGELESAVNIEKAALLSIDAGADFVKTSTGKSAVGATLQAVSVLCDVVQSHYNTTGKRIGIKASGGIRRTVDALLYYDLLAIKLGPAWLNKKYFRIGASALYTNILTELTAANGQKMD